MDNIELEKKLKEHEDRIAYLERMILLGSEGDFPHVSPTKKISLKEFLLMKTPKGDVQKTLCIGFFLERHEGYTSFNLKDVEDGFRKAKEPVPTNINDKINKNIAQGFIMEAKEKKENKKAWTLSRTGELEIENKQN